MYQQLIQIPMKKPNDALQKIWNLALLANMAEYV